MEAIFRMVWITSLYAAVAGIILILLKSVLKNKISPRWHYILWVILIVKLLVPFGPESGFSLFNIIHPVTQEASFSGNIEQYEPIEVIDFQDKSPAPAGNAGVIEDTGLKKTIYIQKIIPYIWFSGFILILVWIISANLFLTRRLRKGNCNTPERIREILEECKKRAGIKGNIKIIVQNAVGTPSLIGVLRPKILLAPNILNLRDQEISYILLHELAHYRRKDLLVNQLLLILQAIHWFNPIIWYSFLKIRQDMESAADESVLALLNTNEHKEYGRALLTVLESISIRTGFVPRFVSMADDRKNIERRIKMIKMADLFQSRRRKVFLTGIICLVILGSILWTSATAEQENNQELLANDYQAAELIKNKTDYVGDHVKVIHLLDSLPYADCRQEVSLKTDKEPYGVNVKYSFNDESTDEQIIPVLSRNALVMFALIKNVEVINFEWKIEGEESQISITRAELQESYPRDLREYGKDIGSLEKLLKSSTLTINASPEIFTPTMSSTPGIKIEPGSIESTERVEYSVNSGNLLTWDRVSGKITAQGKETELTADTPVYWSPLEDNSVLHQEAYETTVKISVLKDSRIIGEKQMIIRFDGSIYSVKPTPDVIISKKAVIDQKQQLLEEAVSQAIKNQGRSYLKGEAAAEGHKILKVEEKDGKAVVYAIATFQWLGFENGILTGISGSGAIPTLITFTKDKNGYYSLQEYKEPVDGAGYTESIKKMFPRELWDSVFKGKYPELARQIEVQAREYLQSIGRDAEVNLGHVEKELVDIKVEASNKLFAEYTKHNPELNKFPYWLGTKEYLVNGERYIYKTSQSKTEDGYDLIAFSKFKEDGSIVLEYRYKIIGNEPELIYTKSVPERK